MNVRGNVKFSSDLNSVMKPHRTYKDPVDKLRVSNPQANSYISNLFSNGIDKIAQKVGEEATELVIASKNSDKKEFIYESADLLFHFLLILQKREIKLNDVINELKTRHK